MQQQTSATPTPYLPPAAGTPTNGRLETTLTRLGELLRALQSGRTDVDAQSPLAALRVDLELHFALEEAGTYFGVVLREHQSLSHAIAELKHEHEALLHHLADLRSVADDPTRSPELIQPIAKLLEDFRLHEQKEANLMQEFFLRDDGNAAD